MKWITEDAAGVVLTIKATPRARANAIAGVEEEWLRVRLQAPPVDGKANEALLRWLADLLAVSKKAVELVTGSTARVKRVRIRGVTAAQVLAAIKMTYD